MHSYLMGTNCAETVRKQRTDHCMPIHNLTPQLWTRTHGTHLFPRLSTAPGTLYTQIMHKLPAPIHAVTGQFSASSTPPITTATTYIYIIKKEEALV